MCAPASFEPSMDRREGPGGEGCPLADTGELCALMFAARVERPGYELGSPSPPCPYWSW